MWLAIKKDSGTVVIARCVCPGGTDEASRHVGAVLYELESYQNHIMTEFKHCTDVPVPWIRGACQGDEAVPTFLLTRRKPQYMHRDQHIVNRNMWDPQHPTDRGEASADEKN